MSDDSDIGRSADFTGSAPRDGWAALVPELLVSDIERSVAFWCGILGFRRAYERRTAKFAYLERDAAQVMLCERNGRWEVGPMLYPFGQGINLQIAVADIAPIMAALDRAALPPYEAVADAWYRVGMQEFGQCEVLVQDPDGYLLRFVQELGQRPAISSSS